MAVSAASSAAGRGADVLERLDASAITPLHWKIMFISGMGFFTDAYDLFIIGVVMAMLKEQWHVSPLAEGLVTSTALLASAVGALLFGRVADMLGRKRIYGYEVLVLAAGAIASALLAEHLVADRLPHHPRHRHRRRLPGQLHDHERIRRQADARHDGHAGLRHAGGGSDRRAAAGRRRCWPRACRTTSIWRLLLAFGAVPALAVFQMRRQLAETPRYLLADGPARRVSRSRRRRARRATAAADARRRAATGGRTATFSEGFAMLVARPRLGGAPGRRQPGLVPDGLRLLRQHSQQPDGAARDHAGQEPAHAYAAAARGVRVAAVPGYLVAAAMMDRMGRKSIQMLGFAMMAISFAAWR